MRSSVISRQGATAVVALLVLAGCSNFDPDLRGSANQFDTSEAVRAGLAPAPVPDSRGIISYPDYQVAVARQGDTVDTIAARLGLPAADLARYNALPQEVVLRQGAIVALPTRVGEPGSGAILNNGTVDVATIAGTAIERADGAPGLPAGNQPVRHQVQPGETAFSIARSYGVPVSALAEWNGLGSDLALREGQFLLIPPQSTPAASDAGAAVAVTPLVATAPGTGSPTPLPPSASEPLPTEDVAPVAAAAAAAPASNPVAEEQTAASDTARLRVPVQGQIIRPYEKGKNDGIIISAAAGSPAIAADAGSVAQITRNTGEVQIVVIRHQGNLLTVYAGVDDIAVSKGDRVSRGQKIAEIQASDRPFLQFEVREGFDSTDPEDFFR